MAALIAGSTRRFISMAHVRPQRKFRQSGPGRTRHGSDRSAPACCRSCGAGRRTRRIVVRSPCNVTTRGSRRSSHERSRRRPSAIASFAASAAVRRTVFPPLRDTCSARRLTRPVFRSAFFDVVPDVAGDDAAIGGAHVADLLRDRRHGARQGRGGGSSACSRCRLLVIWALASLCFAGISLGVQRLAMSSGPLVPAAGPIGAAGSVVCGPLPVQRAEGSLPEEMPEPVFDPVFALGDKALPAFSGSAWSRACGASAAAGR